MHDSGKIGNSWLIVGVPMGILGGIYSTKNHQQGTNRSVPELKSLAIP